MTDWLKLITLPLAQAHLTYLLVNSSLSKRVQPKLPKLLQELLSCPVCTGFWVALGLAKARPVTTLAVAFVGGVLYELKERLLPCKQCTNSVKPSEWKVS